MGIPSTNAKPAEPTNTGAVFGGQHTPIDNYSQQVSQIDDCQLLLKISLPRCTNCLKAEEVLDDLETEGLVQKYEFHRSDYEDPLGDDFASAYVTERYGENLPPLVAFNGTVKKHGTLPDSDSLEAIIVR